MNCPKCNQVMEEGKAKVHGTLGGFLFFSLSWQHLWFYPAGKRKKEIVIYTRNEKPAHRCGQCGLTLIEE